MEAALKYNIDLSESSARLAIKTFLQSYDKDTTQVFFWKIFQCWTLNDCQLKAGITDKELALFLDQLTGLVAATRALQKEGFNETEEKGGVDHE